MRGSCLSSPRVAEALAPFIVASWNGGHGAPDSDLLRRVFAAGPRRRESNITAYVLDADANVVASFHPFSGRQPPGGNDRDEYLLERLADATRSMSLPEPPGGRALHLPDVESGVRIYVQHEDRTRPNYETPVVDAIPWDAVGASLTYPDRERSVDAADLREWWDAIFPPAMMEYQPAEFRDVSGTLTLSPAGRADGARRAILRGTLRLAFPGDAGDALEGEFEAVLSAAGIC